MATMKFLSRGMSRSITVDDIDVSPETLWSTILDIESMPIYLSDLKHVRIIDDHTASRVHRKEDVPRDVQPTKEEDTTFASTSGRIREGFAWEELRFHPLLKKDMKNFKRVTRIGYHSTSGKDCCDSGSVKNKKNRNINDVDCKSMIKQQQQQHHQKYIGIHATSVDDSDLRFRDATKTYTFFLEWEDVIVASDFSCSDQTNRTSTTTTTTTSPSIQQLSSSTSSSSYQLVPSKCRINVTTAFLTYNLCFLIRLKLYQFCGRTRLLDDYLRKEINEIIAEASRREYELQRKA